MTANIAPQRGEKLLDALIYITQRIVVLTFPDAIDARSLKHPLADTLHQLEARHAGRYKIANLCSEVEYGVEDIFPDAERYPIDRGCTPTLDMLHSFCGNARAWLDARPDNVISVLCKGGNGRARVMVASLLLALRAAPSAEAALALFTSKRGGKPVSASPSQTRYVWYFEQCLARAWPRDLSLHTPTLQLLAVNLVTIPSVNWDGLGCDPSFAVEVSTSQLYHSCVYDYRTHVDKVRRVKPKERCVALDVSMHSLYVRGDVRMTFFGEDAHVDSRMFQLSFHTAFVGGNFLCFELAALDGACRDTASKTFDPAFVCELLFAPVPLSDVLATEDGYNETFPDLVAAARAERDAMTS